MRNPIVLAAAAVGLVLAAQTADATICIAESITLRRVEGIVVEHSEDGPGAILPGAVVEITNGSFTAEAISDEDGYFSFGEVRPGNYEIRAELDGFVTAYGTVRVRRQGATEGKVLVISLPFHFEYCGWVTTKTFDQARRLQLADRRGPGARR